MPGVALMRNKLPTEYGAVLGSFAVYMAYAMVSSGHLPLMMPMLFLALLVEGQGQTGEKKTNLFNIHSLPLSLPPTQNRWAPPAKFVCLGIEDKFCWVSRGVGGG